MRLNPVLIESEAGENGEEFKGYSYVMISVQVGMMVV